MNETTDGNISVMPVCIFLKGNYEERKQKRNKRKNIGRNSV